MRWYVHATEYADPEIYGAGSNAVLMIGTVEAPDKAAAEALGRTLANRRESNNNRMTVISFDGVSPVEDAGNE